MSVQNADFYSTNKFNWKWNLTDLQNIEKNGRTVFSCFSCGGGSSMGYKLAGYEVIGCCEIDPQMMKVYKQNNHPKLSYLMDIRDLVKEFKNSVPEELKDLDILDGSPPCSVFSTAGSRESAWNKEKAFREGQSKQRLDDLFFYFLEVARILQPKVIIAENVRGMLVGNAKGWINEIVKIFSEIGYSLQIFVFNAAKMGVPQKRQRVFFIARRKDLNLSELNISFNEKPIPFKDVRTDKGKKLNANSERSKLLKYRLPSDRDIQDINKRVTRKTSGFTSPINHDDEPVQTITAGGSMYRMIDGDFMSNGDIINCQTFPQDYDFMDQSVQYICGMSVPPVMMANVSAEVYNQVFKEYHEKR